MQPDRLKLICMMGSNAPELPAAGRHIAFGLTERFGGATLSLVEGFWSPEGNDARARYSMAGVQAETTLRVELTVLERDGAAAEAALRRLCAEADTRFGLGCRYVHVEISAFRAAHFEI